MKYLLTTLNSKFIHSNLAIRYLKKMAEDLVNIEVEEYTINQSTKYIAADIYKKGVDILAFSTYIWNIEETLEICEILKEVKPEIKIILGGPEVSFEGERLLEEKQFIDYIIEGEGEETFRDFVFYLKGEKHLESIDGLIYRDGDKVIKNSSRELIKDLNNLPTPYEGVDSSLENKIIYYESSRGCPFNCKFCLSSTIKGVRFLSIERVKGDLDNLIDSRVRQVKFVDRTFNANKKYSREILQHIIDRDPENINFHFEVTAHLIDDEFLDFIKDVKPGLFQFEIGVQSTNEKTIGAIGRTTDFNRLREVVGRIKSFNNIHQHLDLIIGLPYEDYKSFRKSFNDVYEIGVEKIQLGFLKLLKGSEIRLNQEEHGYKYLDRPPYEVLENKYLSYREILKLKSIEEMVEKYYDEGYFKNTVEYIIKNHYESPFDFYEDLSIYWDNRGLDKVSHSRNRLYEILVDFIEDREYDLTILENLIKYDYIVNNRAGKFLSRINRLNLSQNIIHEVLKNQEVLEKLPLEYGERPTKKLLKNVEIEKFQISPLNKRPLNKDIYLLFLFRDKGDKAQGEIDISKYVEELI